MVPPRTDRLREGRILAGELLSEDPGGRALARRGIHPDLIELTPKSGKERVGIDAVKEAIRSAQFAPVQSPRKVCLIPFAEKLTVEAANALLKTLEEPPREMAFLLLASHPAELLPTIVSRSRTVRLPPQEGTAIVDRLRSAGYSDGDAEWLARIADRDGEIEGLITEPIDPASAREEAREQVKKADAKGLIDAALSERPILRSLALEAMIERIAGRDPDLLTVGLRYLASKKRETVFLFLHELLSAAFHLIRKGIEEPSEGEIPVSRLRQLSIGLDTAHRAITSYTPAEGALLSAFLGGGSDG